MTINELLALNNLTANDQIPVWDAEATGSTEPTAKITAQNFANAVKSLASLIGTGDLDATPTQGSTKAVQSGGVYNAIAQSTADVIRTGDVVDNLTSTSTTAPLSANMGKTLNDNSFLGPTGRCFTIDPNSYNNNVDSIVDAIHAYYPAGGYFSADILGNLTNPQTNSNRNFIYGFVNSGNSFDWVIIESFIKRFRGIRQGASTFTFNQI